MDFKRWAAGAALLLSAGMLANCSQIFGEGAGESGEGITTAMLVGADGDSANWISHGRTYSEQRYSPLDQLTALGVAALPVLAALAQARTDATTIPVDEQGRRQYVCARYSPVALTVARAAVTSGVRALHRFVSTLDPADIVELSGFALGTFADIDLADDARRAGIDLPR